MFWQTIWIFATQISMVWKYNIVCNKQYLFKIGFEINLVLDNYWISLLVMKWKRVTQGEV